MEKETYRGGYEREIERRIERERAWGWGKEREKRKNT